MASLASQLSRAQLPANFRAQLSQKTKHERPTILFPTGREAADLTIDDIFDIGQQGFAELVALDGRFKTFELDLFAPEYSDAERLMLPEAENKKLDERIRAFLDLAGLYVKITPMAKALEWLIRRFRIQDMNSNDILFMAIPYHDSSHFGNLLRVITLPQDTHWDFLRAAQKRKSHLPRPDLLKAVRRNPSLIKSLNAKLLDLEKDGIRNMALAALCTLISLSYLESRRTVSLDDIDFTMDLMVKPLQRDDIWDQIHAAALLLLNCVSLRVALQGNFVRKVLRWILKNILVPSGPKNVKAQALRTVFNIFESQKKAEVSDSFIEWTVQRSESLIAALDEIKSENIIGFPVSFATKYGLALAQSTCPEARRILATLLEHHCPPSAIKRIIKRLITLDYAQLTADDFLPTMRNLERIHTGIVSKAVADEDIGEDLKDHLRRRLQPAAGKGFNVPFTQKVLRALSPLGGPETCAALRAIESHLTDYPVLPDGIRTAVQRNLCGWDIAVKSTLLSCKILLQQISDEELLSVRSFIHDGKLTETLLRSEDAVIEACLTSDKARRQLSEREESAAWITFSKMASESSDWRFCALLLERIKGRSHAQLLQFAASNPFYLNPGSKSQVLRELVTTLGIYSLAQGGSISKQALELHLQRFQNPFQSIVPNPSVTPVQLSGILSTETLDLEASLNIFVRVLTEEPIEGKRLFLLKLITLHRFSLFDQTLKGELVRTMMEAPLSKGRLIQSYFQRFPRALLLAIDHRDFSEADLDDALGPVTGSWNPHFDVTVALLFSTCLPRLQRRAHGFLAQINLLECRTAGLDEFVKKTLEGGIVDACFHVFCENKNDGMSDSSDTDSDDNGESVKRVSRHFDLFVEMMKSLQYLPSSRKTVLAHFAKVLSFCAIAEYDHDLLLLPDYAVHYPAPILAAHCDEHPEFQNTMFGLLKKEGEERQNILSLMGPQFLKHLGKSAYTQLLRIVFTEDLEKTDLREWAGRQQIDAEILGNILMECVQQNESPIGSKRRKPSVALDNSLLSNILHFILARQSSPPRHHTLTEATLRLLEQQIMAATHNETLDQDKDIQDSLLVLHAAISKDSVDGCLAQKFNVILRVFEISSNVGIHSKAILVMSEVARLQPSAMQSTFMGMFPYMAVGRKSKSSSGILKHDDEYTLMVLERCIQTVFPMLFKVDRRIPVEEEIQLCMPMVDAIVDSAKYIPGKRRDRLFEILFKCIDMESTKAHIHALVIIRLVLQEFLSSIMAGGSENATNSKFDHIKYATDLLRDSQPGLVSRTVANIVHLLDNAKTPWLNRSSGSPVDTSWIRKTSLSIAIDVLGSRRPVSGSDILARTLLSKLASTDYQSQLYQIGKLAAGTLGDQEFLETVRPLCLSPQPETMLRSLGHIRDRLDSRTTLPSLGYLDLVGDCLTILKRSELDVTPGVAALGVLSTLLLLVASDGSFDKIRADPTPVLLKGAFRKVAQLDSARLVCLGRLVLASSGVVLPQFNDILELLVDELEVCRTDDTSRGKAVFDSAAGAFFACVRAFPDMLGKYIPRFLHILSRHRGSPRSGRLTSIFNEICSAVDARTLIKQLGVFHRALRDQLCLSVSEGRNSHGREYLDAYFGAFRGIVGPCLQMQSVDDTIKHERAISSILKNALVTAGDLSQTTENWQDCVSICEVFVSFALRLSEEIFRPQWLKVVKETKATIILKILEMLLDRILALTFPYLATAFHVLLSSLQEEGDSQAKGQSMTCIIKWLKCDQQGFLTQERFDLLLPNLLRQLRETAEEGPWVSRSLVRECIGLLVSTGSGHEETNWRTVHSSLLELAKGGTSASKLAAIGAIETNYQHLEQAYLVTLPETMPVIAELLEDSDKQVALAADKLRIAIEGYLGESLDSYLSK